MERDAPVDGYRRVAHLRVLFDSRSLRLSSPAFRAAISDVLTRIQATGQVTQIHSPLDPRFANLIAPDQRAALLQFQITGPVDTAASRVAPVLAAVQAAAAGHPQIQIAETGDASITKAVNDTVFRDLRRAEALSFPITLVVLLIAFGAVVAALLPLGLATIEVPLAGTGEDATSVHALATLREKVIPATLGKIPGAQVAVTGETAGTADFNTVMGQRSAWVFTFVLVLAFVLLLVSFRSVVIPAAAVILNLLSVGAACGVVVALFQWGWGQWLFRFTSVHSVASWLPLFLFVVLFGLSMDYHVFVLSRIRESYDRTGRTDQAVAHGIKISAGVITAAAIIMVFVFLTFATMSMVQLKEMGVGLAVAVLLDATIVRAMLLPATMKLLGPRNWYLPRWLGWLPGKRDAGLGGVDQEGQGLLEVEPDRVGVVRQVSDR